MPGFAFKAVIIGGGYSTGREIAEFFVPVGPWGGVAAMALAMVLWSLICVVTFLLARRIGSYDYRPFFRALLGPGLGRLRGILFLLLHPDPRGLRRGGWRARRGDVRLADTRGHALVLMASIAAFTAFGNRSVEWLFKYASFFLYGVYALFVIFAFQRFGPQIGEGFAQASGTDGWVGAGITYASYNAIAAAVILPVLRHLTSDRDAVVAGLLAGPLAIIPALLFFLCMVAFYPGIGAEVLPADFMLRQMGLPLLHVGFQLMIFAALLQSSVSSVHAINERIAGALAERGRGFSPAQRLACTVTLLVARHFRRAAVRPRRADREGIPGARLHADCLSSSCPCSPSACGAS